MKQVKLIVGDWSGDGHEKSEDFFVEVDDAIDLNKFYKKGTKLLGVNFIEKFCTDYEDQYVSSKFWKLLKSKTELPERLVRVVENEEYYYDENFEGYDNEDSGEDDTPPSPDHHSLQPTTFVIIYLEICKLGGLENYKLVEDTFETIDIGGYGLFY